MTGVLRVPRLPQPKARRRSPCLLIRPRREGLERLGDAITVRASLIRPRPSQLADRVELFHQGARARAQQRAATARAAVDGPPGDDVPAVGGPLHRDTAGAVARRALRAGAAGLLLPLRGAGGAELDPPVHATC